MHAVVHRAQILILQFPVHRSAAAAPTDSFLFLFYSVYRKSTQINEQGIN